MNIRSNKTYQIWIPFCILIQFSCTKQLLDIQPQQSVSSSAAIVDSSTALTALYGVYSQLQNSNYYGGGGYAAMAYLSGGDNLWVGTLNYYGDFVNHAYQSDNTLVNNVWYQIYTVSNGANNVIDRVNALSSTSISQSAKNQFLGESYFIRALAYFDLGRAWANVPIILKATTSVDDQDGIKQSTQKEAYTQVLSDLSLAESLLPLTTNRNRATRKTVYALAARVHLYNEDWQDAIDYSTKIIDDQNYQLISWSAFLNGTNTNESIFELAFSTSDQSAHYSTWSSVTARNQLGPNSTIYNLLQDPQVGGDRSVLIKNNSTALNTNYYVQQLYWRTTGENPTYILRLSEQYLIRAEAYLKIASPNISAALSDLNAVRQRANVSALNLTDKDSILSAIADERHVEFALEPQRWFDLVRTEKVGDVLGVTDKNKWIFPIPYADLQTNSDLVQNAGY